MAVTVILVGALTAAHMAWSVGYGPFEGEGFVQHAQFQKLAEDARRGRINSLREALISIRRESCSDAEGEYRLMLLSHLTELQSEWRELTGTDFPLPSCQDFRGPGVVG